MIGDKAMMYTNDERVKKIINFSQDFKWYYFIPGYGMFIWIAVLQDHTKISSSWGHETHIGFKFKGEFHYKLLFLILAIPSIALNVLPFLYRNLWRKRLKKLDLHS